MLTSNSLGKVDPYLQVKGSNAFISDTSLTPVFPFNRFYHDYSSPTPMGVTAPIPVMTTLLLYIAFIYMFLIIEKVN